ncbi:MAG: hypothetical protein J6U25_00265, partial [Clostridia bacterium]|nr:hypothetical protein [Clostridia bacterium]
MRENTVKNRIIIFVLTIVTVLFMSMGVFGALFEKKPTAYAASYSFNSAADFVAYSKTYGAANQYDVISIDITAGYSDLDGFVSLGTSSAPFAGRLTISDPLSFFNCPLFDYVSTDMTLVGGLTLSRKAAKTGSYDGTSDGALFANHVVAGTVPASWSLILEEADSNQAETFKGVFGDIGANAEVDLTFTNRMPNGSALNSMNVSGSGDTGLIAGSIGTGATLGVTTTAYSGGNITVTSTGGEAGGLVGKMASGSTLNLKSANNSRISSVSASGSGKYAGGVVGHNDGGTINVSVASYDISALSVSGNKGAGGVCGYYVNYAASYDLNLNKYAFSSTTQISATASDSYAGGAFGAFINEGSASTVTVSGNVGVKLDSASRRGGIIGWYNTDDLTNTLKITNVVSDVWCNGNNTRAGLIGRIDDNSTAYVSISDVTCTARNTISAGLIGYVGTGGNFIDVSGNVTISGNLSGGGGLIDNLSSGVLRLAGVTDISGVSSVTGQIVRARDKSLIYALGNGKDYTPATIDPVTSQITTPASGWKLIRRSTSLDVDDIYGWGQVLRVDGTNLNESDLFTVNSTA